jgi:predicted MarR family transcription regulator
MNLLSTHGMVLLCISEDKNLRLRDIAAKTEMTERTVWNSINDLVSSGVIERHKEGRRNTYQVTPNLILPTGTGGSLSVQKIIDAMVATTPPTDGKKPSRAKASAG